MQPGAVYLVLADFRGRVDEDSEATVVVSWQDAKRAWVDEFRRTTALPKGITSAWTPTAVAARAPAGVAYAVVMLFADKQKPDATLAFDNVRLFQVKPPPAAAPTAKP